MIARRPIAFSLLELVLVLVIIGIALVAVTPSLGGWSRGMSLRTQGDELLAATRLARDRAVTTATPHTLVVSDGGVGWSVQRVEAAPSDTGLPLTEAEYALPPGWVLEMESPAGESMTRATFYPDGRGEPATLTLTSDRGESVGFARESTASGFLRVSEVR